MKSIESQAELFGGHLAEIIGWASGDPRPKLSNLCQMNRPILDVLVEYRANQPVLPNIRVKMSQQVVEPLQAPDPNVKTSIVLIHILLAAAFTEYTNKRCIAITCLT